MPNPYSVYMHDTDTRKLFADDYRFDSHGCTRVDNVRDLAAWILQDGPPGWDRAAIDAGIAAGQTKVINLPRKMPVAWVYLTGWVTRDGTVEFRDDVYKHDEALDRNASRRCRGRRLRRAGADHRSEAGFDRQPVITRGSAGRPRHNASVVSDGHRRCARWFWSASCRRRTARNLASSWRHPASRTDSWSPDFYRHIGRVLEEGKFHLGFFDDRLSMPDMYGRDHAPHRRRTAFVA